VKTRGVAVNGGMLPTEGYERLMTLRIAFWRVAVARFRERADPFARSGQPRIAGFSSRGGLYRSHQRVERDEVEHPPNVVGERGQTELSPHLLQSPHEECALIHPLLDRAEWVLDRLASPAENAGRLRQTSGHLVQHGFVFQPRH
jgi:hypothetical protein